MGIEAFIIPWLFAMSMIAVAGVVSLDQRLGLVRKHQRWVDPDNRDTGFWARQSLKAAIVVFALWQIALILKQGLL